MGASDGDADGISRLSAPAARNEPRPWTLLVLAGALGLHGLGLTGPGPARADEPPTNPAEAASVKSAVETSSATATSMRPEAPARALSVDELTRLRAAEQGPVGEPLAAPAVIPVMVDPAAEPASPARSQPATDAQPDPGRAARQPPAVERADDAKTADAPAPGSPAPESSAPESSAPESSAPDPAAPREPSAGPPTAYPPGAASDQPAARPEPPRDYAGRVSLGQISADLITLSGHQRLRFGSMPEIDPARRNGRMTLIYFWGAWCKPCLEEMPQLAEIATRYADRVTVIGLSDGYLDSRSYPEKVDEVQRLIASHTGLHQQYFTINSDAINQIFESRTAVLPALAVFDQAGKLSYRALGSIVDPEHHRSLMDTLLGPRPSTDQAPPAPPPEQSKAATGPAATSQTLEMHQQQHRQHRPSESD